MLAILSIFPIFCIIFTQVKSDDYTVNCSAGLLKGTYYWGKSYTKPQWIRAFYGIAYAKAPEKTLRFEPPENETRYPDYSTAYALGSMCPQAPTFKKLYYYSGYEKCLYLNVYTPWPTDATRDKKLPVMVWIHGGSFNTGSGSWELYGADYLVAEGVILVTVNYRLGVLGFLSAPELGIYGNMGLKDQRAALRWVNDNIDAFGGNKSQITLFGESAGAASVHYLMMDKTLHNSTHKLFQRAILQSGSAFNPWASQFEPQQRFKNLTKFLFGKENATKPELENVNLKDLMVKSMTNMPTSEDKRRATDPVFNPVIEHENSIDPIIQKPVEEQMENFADVDIMMGFNSAEGLLAATRADEDSKEIEETLKDIERVIPRDAYIWENSTGAEQQKAIKLLKELYNKTENQTEKQKYVRLMGDAWFEYGIYRLLNKTLEKTGRNGKVFFYKLSDDSYSVYKDYIITNWKDFKGVCHTDDLGYLFRMQPHIGAHIYHSLWIPPAGVKTHMRLITMWTNFAKTGNPMTNSDNKSYDPYNVLPGKKWDAIEKKKMQYLEMNKTTVEMKEYVELNRMREWDKVYELGREAHKKKEKEEKEKEEEKKKESQKSQNQS